MNTYPEYHYVKDCLNKIEDKLNWGKSDDWHNDMFIELSEKIQLQTGVLLSPTTLKRVWGKVNYKSAPSISTLNTLAQFAGYENWRAFKTETKLKKTNWFEHKITPNLGFIMGAAAIMTIIFLSFYSLLGGDQNLDDLDLDAIKFESKSITDGLPNTVVFDFDLSPIASDSILIQQYWDKTKTISINKTQTQATGQYYYPGYFRAKLVVDGIILKEHDLFIQSDGWLGTLDYEPVPKYAKQSSILSTNSLAFSHSISDEIVSSDAPIISSFHRIEDFSAFSGDDFELNSEIKVNYNDKWAVCQLARIAVIGTKSAIIISFAIPGCSSELGVMLSEKYLDGKQVDLSSLSTDLSENKSIQLKVINKNITLFINNTAVFNNSFENSIGTIAGVRYHFLGVGEVHKSVLTSSTTELDLLK